MDDPDGAGFPWNPKTFSEIIPGKLVNKEKEEKTWGDVDADVIGLYFSAHWVSVWGREGGRGGGGREGRRGRARGEGGGGGR